MKKAIFVFICVINISLAAAQTYTVETIIPPGTLSRVIAFDFMPNGNYIITEQGGPVRIFTPGGQISSIFWYFTDSCNSSGELGTIGVCLDPNFTANHYVYVYTVKGTTGSLIYNNRIWRFTENNGAGTNPLLIFDTQITMGGNTHASGNMHFGNDGKLYVSVGQTGPCSSQNLTCPRGKILRINGDGTAPTSNPFYDDGNPNTGNDDRIWAYGLRNSFDFCFSLVNDSIYATENTATTNDEINLIKRGQNYGFPVCEEYCHNPLYVDPIGLSMRPAIATTGIMIYNGAPMPWLNGKLIYSSSATGRIYFCTLGRPPLYDTITAKDSLLPDAGSLVTTMKQGTDGFIYFTSYNNKFMRLKPFVNGVNDPGTVVNFRLEQNYPNPFNPSTKINYEIPEENFVSLKIYNVQGALIETLVNERKRRGNYEVEWKSHAPASGIYFYELISGSFKSRKKMVLIK